MTQSFKSIGENIGISAASVDRYLPELIADRDNILPSDVMQQRQESGFTYPRKAQTDLKMVRKVIENNPDAPVRDLAYLVKCNSKTIHQALKEIKEETQGTGNDSVINTIDAEIAKLQKRRIDGLDKKSKQRISRQLKEKGVLYKKVRGKRDEGNAWIRLADAIAGFCRDTEENKPYTQSLNPMLDHKGFLIRL